MKDRVMFVILLVGCSLFVLLGVIGFLAATAYPNFKQAQTRSRVARTMADMRSMDAAIEAYGIDVDFYPAYSTNPEENLFGNVQGEREVFANVPTFPTPAGAMRTLTAPDPYISSMPQDVFAPQGATFAFYSTPGPVKIAGWILWSPGPDRTYDLNLDNIRQAYNPSTGRLSEMLVEYTYDPTNGIYSAGDLWRAKR